MSAERQTLDEALDAAHERCTMAQAELIDRLVRSHVITKAEREPILRHLTAGTMTKDRASAGITWLLATIKERKKIERERA